MVSALAGAALKKVGVEMVVEGVESFVRDLAKGNAEISLFGKRAKEAASDMSFFEKAMNFVGDTLRRVFEIASGILVADVFRKIASGIAEMVKGAFDAGVAFQQLEVRLEGLLARDISERLGIPIQNAFGNASVEAEQLFDWITKIALASPLGTQAVADVFTLAKGYGFATDMAKDLTEAVVNFTSGMGLGNVEMKRIIENFGQMQFQGKVTGTELRDLARGAFVPVLDILERIKQQMEGGAGFVDLSEDITKTTAKIEEYKDKLAIAEQRQREFTDATKESVRMSTANQIENYKQKIEELAVELAGMNAITEGTGEITEEMFKKIQDEGIPAELFFKEFINMVNEDFPDAARRASRTFEGVRGNLKDLTQDLIGLHVVRPVLDAISAPIADLIDALTTGERGEKFVFELRNIGEGFKKFIEGFAQYLPSADKIAEGIINFLEKIRIHLNTLGSVFKESGFKGFFEELMTILEIEAPDLSGTLSNLLDPLMEGLQNLRDFWQAHGPGISEAIGRMVKALVPLVSTLIIDGLQLLADGFKSLTQWIVDHGPQIESGLQGFADKFENEIIPAVSRALQWLWDNREAVLAVALAVATAIKTFSIMVSIVTTVVGVLGTLLTAVIVLLSPIGLVVSALTAFSIAVGVVVGALVYFRQHIALALSSFISFASSLATRAYSASIGVLNAFTHISWSWVGRNIMQGIINGMWSLFGSLLSTAINIAISVYNTMKSILGIRSPSTLFAGLGQNIAAGMVQGMLEGIPAVAGAAQALASATLGSMNAAPAYVQNSNVTYNSRKEFNLSVTSNAQSEPIIADFRMMEGMLS